MACFQLSSAVVVPGFADTKGQSQNADVSTVPEPTQCGFHLFSQWVGKGLREVWDGTHQCDFGAVR